MASRPEFPCREPGRKSFWRGLPALAQSSTYRTKYSAIRALGTQPINFPSGNVPDYYTALCSCGRVISTGSTWCRECWLNRPKKILRLLDSQIYTLEGESCRKIALTKGQWAIVSEEDYDYLIQFNWCAFQSPKVKNAYYAKRDVVEGHGDKKIKRSILMHRLIYERAFEKLPNGFHADHRNRQPLDNRISNLRKATNQENCFNTGKHSNNTSGYKGVYWHRRKNCWFGKITKDRKQYMLGYFVDPKEAHDAYKRAALQLHGEFACFG